MRPTLLFLHGLGESGLCFLEAYDVMPLRTFNLVMPDLIGYRRSASALSSTYSFDQQIERLLRLIDHFDLREITLIGHSMGGDIATWLCASEPHDRICRLVNVEGNLTSDDLFISEKVVEATEQCMFDTWFQNFKQQQWARDTVWSRRYFTSLQMCKPAAFQGHALEMYKNTIPSNDGGIGQTCRLYQELTLPKVYCWGSTLSGQTQRLIRDQAMDNKYFDGASHWIMIDQPDAFYRFLGSFVSK